MQISAPSDSNELTYHRELVMSLNIAFDSLALTLGVSFPHLQGQLDGIRSQLNNQFSSTDHALAEHRLRGRGLRATALRLVLGEKAEEQISAGIPQPVPGSDSKEHASRVREAVHSLRQCLDIFAFGSGEYYRWNLEEGPKLPDSLLVYTTHRMNVPGIRIHRKSTLYYGYENGTDSLIFPLDDAKVSFAVVHSNGTVGVYQYVSLEDLWVYHTNVEYICPEQLEQRGKAYLATAGLVVNSEDALTLADVFTTLDSKFDELEIEEVDQLPRLEQTLSGMMDSMRHVKAASAQRLVKVHEHPSEQTRMVNRTLYLSKRGHWFTFTRTQTIDSTNDQVESTVYRFDSSVQLFRSSGFDTLPYRTRPEILNHCLAIVQECKETNISSNDQGK